MEKRPTHRVIFDRLGLASSLGQDAQEIMADRMGDPTDPMHAEPSSSASVSKLRPRPFKPAPGGKHG